MKINDVQTLLLRRFVLPRESEFRKTMRRFTIAEKAVFYFFAVLFILSSVFMAFQVSNSFLIEVPTRGGTLVEGVIGNPRFVNPVLALSEADKNLTALVYSGLVHITPTGEVENDLAEEITISPNRLSYTARIREDAKFHDGKPVTADDVIFTIQKVVDPMIKSPRRGDWDGVIISKLDERTVTFTLKTPYAPFINNLSIGILPREIWKNVTAEEFAFSQFNTLPVGSGPYEVASVKRNSGGIPDYYRLVPFDSVTGRDPYISSIIFRFYPSETALLEAYESGDIESFGGITPDKALSIEDSRSNVISSPLPRVFAVFFNQNQSKLLAEKSVRQALDLASPKERIVENVLGGFASPIDGPLPAGLFPWASERATSSEYEARFSYAEELLAKAGWKRGAETGVLEKKSGNANIELSFTLSTGDAPELKQVAADLISAWRDLGVDAKLAVHETGDLNQNVIRPRNFDALLFGEVVGRDADVYPFWHSSQRSDPGLNIASYANSRADRLLATARAASEREDMEENYKAFDSEIKADVPAVFLYTPSYLYVVPKDLKAVALGSLSSPQDRFLGVRDWYIETDRVWKIFTE